VGARFMTVIQESLHMLIQRSFPEHDHVVQNTLAGWNQSPVPRRHAATVIAELRAPP
jgi:hypothetical protein